MNDQCPLTDGAVCFQSSQFPDEFLHYVRPSIPEDWIKRVDSDVPETKLWSIGIEAHMGESKMSLGLPRDFSRWFALVRIWSPWLAPRHGQGNFAPTEDAVLCSFLRSDGLHLVLLAASGINDILTVFKPDGDGEVVVSSRNDGEQGGTARVIAAVGRNFDTANAAVMYYARKLVRGYEHMSSEVQTEMQAAIEKGVKAEWLENWYDGLTYCTWNGLGQDLTEAKIFNALDVLEKNGIKITNLIIDDNWQSLDNHGESQFRRGWADFDANKEGFPQGLKHTVFELRDRHPNIHHVAVWHAILGYWGGVAPDGNIAKKYKTKQVRKQEGLAGGVMTVVDADDAQRMYEDFYKFLSEAGIDSVKTDAQFFLDLLDDTEDRRRFIKTYQDAWTISSLRYFSIKAISCMSQVPQIMFHSQLPLDKPRYMVRNSDDFFPEIPTSHPWHVFTNAHNSVFTSHLNVLPDWDMFQTSHPYSSFHAAARCISGGPIYFTDEPGKHDLELIYQMTAPTTQGKTVILRPSIIGKTVKVYTAYEEERLLRVGTYHGTSTNGTAILGIFNVSERPLAEFIPLSEFPGVQKGYEYVVRSHSTGEISRAMTEAENSPLSSLEVAVKGYEILSAYPVSTFTLKGSRGIRDDATKVAVLGLLGKMTGAAAIMNSDLYVEETGRLKVWCSLKALGTLGIYISDLPKRSIEHEFMILISGKPVPFHTVTKSSVSDCVLEIDVQRAWKEMGLSSGWSNEAGLDVLFG